MQFPSVLVVIIVLLTPVMPAGGATQTDWSGGSSVPGPVTGWQSAFQSAAGTSWCSVPGQLSLSSTPLSEPVEHPVIINLDGASSAWGCDIDQDGDTDLLATGWDQDEMAWWRNDGGNPISWTKQIIDVSFIGSIFVRTEDIDGDGDPDVVGAGWAGNIIAWWRNDGGNPISWTRQNIDQNYIEAHEVHPIDLDSDGDIDLLGAAAGSAEIAWWSNMGGSPIQWTRQTIGANLPGVRSAEPYDINGDGHIDVVGAVVGTDELCWWRNSGDSPPVWTKHIISSTYDRAHDTSVCDLDRDGDPDIVGAAWSPTSGRISWMRNDGGDPVTWTEQIVQADYAYALTVRTADVDGDGDPDIIGTASGPAQVAWWRNEGNAASWTHHVIAGDYPGAHGIEVWDLDDDGDLDVVGTGFINNKVSWWDFTEFISDGNLVSSVLDTLMISQNPVLEWTAVVPADTDIQFRLRDSSDPEDMGAWSNPITQSGAIPGSLERYIQYQILLTSNDPLRSPILKDVTAVVASTPENLEIELILPSMQFRDEDVFRLDLSVINHWATRSVDLYILLGVFGEYWCYPSWISLANDIDFETIDVSAGSLNLINIIPDVILPDIGPVGPLYFYSAAFLEGSLSADSLISNVSSVEFSFI
jgi:FG-GAP-like repeat